MEKFIYSTGKQRCLESKYIGSIGSIGPGGGVGGVEQRWKYSLAQMGPELGKNMEEDPKVKKLRRVICL